MSPLNGSKPARTYEMLLGCETRQCSHRGLVSVGRPTRNHNQTQIAVKVQLSRDKQVASWLLGFRPNSEPMGLPRFGFEL